MINLDFLQCPRCAQPVNLEDVVDMNEDTSEQPVYVCINCHEKLTEKLRREQRDKQIEHEIMLEAQKAQERENKSFRELESRYCNGDC